MKKVKFNDRFLLYEWYRIIAPISAIVTIFSIVITVSEKYKGYLLFTIIILCFFLYLYLWINANNLKEKKMNVNSNAITIKFGDIFQEEGLKIIAFNEYFDTKVDDRIISSNSINGMYLNTYVENIKKLDDEIKKSKDLSKKIVKSTTNPSRDGKKIKYELGSTYKNNDYLLLAFSKFDNKNNARISTKEYFNCLLSLWENIDINYNGKKIVLPLLGSGITRFKDSSIITDQELLEFIVSSIKVSKINYSYSHEIIVIIHPTKRKEINLYNIN